MKMSNIDVLISMSILVIILFVKDQYFNCIAYFYSHMNKDYKSKIFECY